MMKKAIIVDLDGCLCDFDHRAHLYPAYSSANTAEMYKAFNEACDSDPINDTVHNLIIDAVRGDGEITDSWETTQVIFLTARPDTYEDRTANWLEANLNSQIDDYILLMREEGDMSRSVDVKREIYEKHIKPYYEVMFAIDDQDSIIELWQSLGIDTLQFKKGTR